MKSPLGLTDSCGKAVYFSPYNHFQIDYICAMENYIVSSRKYRPASFDTVVGQHHITGTLKNAIRTQQLAQAFLFCGPRGVGKTTCARIFAKTINCTDITAEGEACNACESCLSFNRGASMAIHELDAASNNSVDDIRSLVEQVRYAPQGAKYKIYIIDEVHMLSTSAFNAFLKTLEEPPSYAIFILATTEKHKILPTILSRCQIFDFNRIQVADIAAQLARICDKEGVTYEPKALHIIAQKADGALRDALSIMDQVVSFSAGDLSYAAVIDNLNIIDHDYFFQITDLLLQQDLAGVSVLLDEVISKGFEGINFLTGLSSHFRNLLMTKDSRTLKLLEVSDDIKQLYHAQTDRASAGFLLTALNMASHAEINYKQSKQPRLLVELALMKMCFVNQLLQPDQLAEAVKKKVADAPSIAFTNPTAAAIKVQAVATDTPPRSEAHLSPSGFAPDSGATTAKQPPKATASLKGGRIKIGKNLADIKAHSLSETNAEEETAKVYERSELRFEEAWSKLLSEIKALKKEYLYSILSEAKPVLDADQKFEITIYSEAQQQLFEEEKQELIEKIRHYTGNFSIGFNYKILENESNIIKPVTSLDKFGQMALKNEVLVRFVDRLNLDIDY